MKEKFDRDMDIFIEMIHSKVNQSISKSFEPIAGDEIMFWGGVWVKMYPSDLVVLNSIKSCVFYYEIEWMIDFIETISHMKQQTDKIKKKYTL